MPEILGRLRTPRLTSAPASPQPGEMYYDSTGNQLYWYNGSQWVAAGGAGTPVMHMVGGSTAAITPNAWQKVPLAGYGSFIGYTGGGLDVANGRYVVPVNGYYQVSALVYFSVTYSGLSLCIGSVWVNGAESFRGDRVVANVPPSPGNIRCGAADTLSLNQGDVVELYGYATGAGTMGGSGSILALYQVPYNIPGATGPAGSATSAGMSRTMPVSPVDGQVWLYPADEIGTMWAFRYNAGSSSAYKWEFIGGGALLSGPAGNVQTGSATWIDFVGGPALTCPFAGDYDFEFGGWSEQTVDGISNVYFGLVNAGTAGWNAHFIPLTAWQSTNMTHSWPWTGRAAGSVTSMQVNASLSNVFQNGWIRMTPIRVG